MRSEGMAGMCDAGLKPESTSGHRFCRRFETVVGRGDAVLSALFEEYIHCFRKVSGNSRHQNALLRCMHTAVELAFSTIVPLVYPNAVSAVEDLHPVMRAVCALYLKHLRRSWFALENDRLDALYRILANGEIKVD